MEHVVSSKSESRLEYGLDLRILVQDKLGNITGLNVFMYHAMPYAVLVIYCCKRIDRTYAEVGLIYSQNFYLILDAHFI